MINGKVVNNTFCNIYTCLGEFKYFLPIVTRNYRTGQVASPSVNEVVISRVRTGSWKWDANGDRKTRRYSAKFSQGNSVKAIQSIDLRLGPGTNYEKFTTIPNGTLGKIAVQMNNLNGVSAKSGYWWYVDFGGGQIGWAPESALVKP